LPTRTNAALRADDLDRLLDEAEEQDVSQHESQRDVSEARGTIGATHGPAQLGAGVSTSAEHLADRTRTFRQRKLEVLERHLADYKSALIDGVARCRTRHFALIVDDFYLLAPSVQPDVIDYLHRLLRGTGGYLKIGTIRHRTKLIRYDNGQTIGVEPRQDVETIDLDRTFENVDQTAAYLSEMLNSMGAEVGVDDASARYLSPDALFQLTLCSGGVPRDFLNIFVEGVIAARSAGATRWLTPMHIYKGAARESYLTKLRNFREDAGGDVAPLERLFQDLMYFCLKEKRKTAFLISQYEAQADPEGHELIQELMDFKLVHVIEANTSAASGRPGRYEAYTLDFSAFVEPRRRGIEIVEFWKTDDSHRRRGVREAPVYDLARARAAAEAPTDADAGAAAESLDAELGLETSDE